MKVKSIFQNILPNSSNSRRAGRSRSENNEFHRLASSDIPDNTNFHRRTDQSTAPVSRSHNVRQQLIPVNQQPIELDNFQHASSAILPDKGSSRNPPDGCNSGSENQHESEFFVSSRQFDDAFQVYNPTSEELPQYENDDILPFELSDVRLKFREIISGETDIVEEAVSRIYSQSERHGKCDNKMCGCCACKLRLGKTYMILIFGTLIALLCVVSMAILFLNGDGKNISTKHLSDLGILSAHEWPLHDIESKELNISFDTLQRSHQLWDIRLLKDDNNKIPEKNKIEKSDLPLKIKVIVRQQQYQYPGLFTLNGEFIDQTIAGDVFHEAEKLLERNLYENSTKAEILTWKGEATHFAIEELKRRLNISQNGDSLEGIFDDHLCDKDINPRCNTTSWFRSANGSCNNVLKKTWGSQYAPFRRIINPVKEQLPLLPNSSTEQLTGGISVIDGEASAILPLWGMFILHDTTKTAESQGSGACYSTRTPIQTVDAKLQKERCTSIYSSNITNSAATSREKNECFLSSPCPAIYPACQIGHPRTSFNLVTSYIDASNIYGSSEEKMNKLRLKKMGKMKEKLVKHKQGKGFLPIAHEQNETCADGSGDTCFISGDEDVNQLSALTALNTIFMRQHNWVASWLHRVNPLWDDERLFQESRRILIAQIQHITYNEFLPQFLGNQMMNDSGLVSEKAGFYELYDPLVDPSVSDAFAGAVGSFWYSMAVGKIQLIWKKGKLAKKMIHDIKMEIFRPEILMERYGHLEAIIRGFASLTVNRVGLEFSPQLRSLPLKRSNLTVDLVKLVLDAGRYLKLVPYLEWRKTCGFEQIKSFEEAKVYWYEEAHARIASVYRNVEHVDLFTGMLAEIPIPSGRVGPTLACLLTDQFLRFKKGDRFWYEGDVYFHHFTELQLKTIRETTLARILCDNTDLYFDQVQKWSMLLKSPQTNPVLSCSDSEQIPNLNFHLWKESPSNQNQIDNENDNDDDWDFESIEMGNSEDETSSENVVSESRSENSTDSLATTTVKNSPSLIQNASGIHPTNATSVKTSRSTRAMKRHAVFHSNIYI